MVFDLTFENCLLGNRITRVICTTIASVADRPPRNINLIDGTNAIGDDASVFPCLPRVRRTLEYIHICVCDFGLVFIIERDAGI